MSFSVLEFLENIVAQAFKEKEETPLTHEEFRMAVNSSAVDPMDFVEAMKKRDFSLLSSIAKKLTIWILQKRDSRNRKN